MVFEYLAQKHPLHKAILHNDIKAFKDAFEPYLLDDQDKWGLTAYLMVKLLQKELFFPFFSISREKNFKVENKYGLHHLNTANFEKALEFNYIDGLKFKDHKTLISIIKKCKKANIDKEQYWYGCYYAKEIAEGITSDVTIKWINPILEYGLFTNVLLKKGSYVGHYGGEVRKHQKGDEKNPYCFEYQISYDADSVYTVDPKNEGNLCRFINHSYKPNLMPRLAYCNNIMYIIFIASRDIQAHEELTFDYGPKYWERREAPILI
jgi:hypothetical protein